MKPFLLLALLALAGYTSAQAKQDPMLYHVAVQFNPDSSFMHGQVEIQNPTDSCFFLTRGLKIQSVIADGKSVRFQEKSFGATSESNQFAIAFIPQKMVVEYSGQIKAEDYPKTVSSINGINPEWIELSDHIDWFPRLAKTAAFEYEMEVNVPKNFVTVLGGQVVKTKNLGKRSISKWVTGKPTYGITLLSVPGLKKAAIAQDGLNLEIYYDKLAPAYIDSMKNDLLKSVGLLTELFGPTGTDCVVKIAYSPRSAGGYARRPMLLVSEKYALEQRSLKYGYARDFRLNTHEIAHYWSFANTGTSEDWMNEGLAEFSAYLISEKIIGKDFSALLLSEYEGIVTHTKTQTAIAETPNDSWEREVNRYYKPTLLLNELRLKYGDEKLGQFLKTLYSRMTKAPVATTGLFIEVLEQTMGKEAKVFFAEAIYRKDWNIEVPSATNPAQATDLTFAGTWSGPLTQFGTTAKFVLNLALKDGKLEPSLDSPDQNVTNIPVSELLIEGDVVSFRVGIASAVYKGTLDRTNQVIRGVWTQRSVDYPLNITKENR